MIFSDISTVLPQIAIACGSIIVLLASLFVCKKNSKKIYILTQITILAGIYFVVKQFFMANGSGFGGETAVNHFVTLLELFDLIVAFFVLVYSREYAIDNKMPTNDFYILVLLSLLGSLVLISGTSLLTIYVGLELLSLPMYAIIAIRRNFYKGSEAAIKYFVLGAIASGLLLFGMTFIYGIVGSVNLVDISTYMAIHGISSYHDIYILSMVLIVSAVLFKLGAAPFHMWVPDIYEGSPNGVTVYVATIPKIAAFAMLVNILFLGFDHINHSWVSLLIVVSVLSLFIGNIVALAQSNIKRLFGYSTVAHVGFILLALTLKPNSLAVTTAFFYIIVYVLMALAGFGVLIIAGKKGYEIEKVSHFSGLNKKNPWLAFLLMIILFSMAGIPPFAGFTAKFFVINGLIGQHNYVLACYVLFISVIASYYYLNIIKVMYFDEPRNIDKIHTSLSIKVILTINVALLVILGIFPGLLVNSASFSSGIF